MQSHRVCNEHCPMQCCRRRGSDSHPVRCRSYLSVPGLLSHMCHLVVVRASRIEGPVLNAACAAITEPVKHEAQELRSTCLVLAFRGISIIDMPRPCLKPNRTPAIVYSTSTLFAVSRRPWFSTWEGILAQSLGWQRASSLR